MAIKVKPAEAYLRLGTAELRDRLANGGVTATELVESLIAQIALREPDVGAWAWFDPEFVRAQAKHLDDMRRAGHAIGPLHGLPVGIKDIVDTAKIPTENGTAIDKGRVPVRDAVIVERLRAAGAIVMGKTVTTELAFMHPGKTANPHNPAHTPGGSSSGSAAAVAAAMVPLAIGTQTGGSVIRPAAYCGVTGFKPTFGAIPRTGILAQSPSLDTVGVFAVDAAGAALLAEALFGGDADDPATTLAPHPKLFEIANAPPPLAPLFAAVRLPGSQAMEPDLVEAMGELTAALGDQAFEIELPSLFDQAADQREIINFAEMARYYYRYGRDGADLLGAPTREAIANGNATLARDYIGALDWPKVLNAALEEVFERCDAILCPAAPGPAPQGLEGTGDAIFNGLWTLCGVPAVTVPLLTASNGMPMGVQLVGPKGNDARLLRCAKWLMDWADSEE
ncbi:MAG: amidase [Pseudomonadota bacterium]